MGAGYYKAPDGHTDSSVSLGLAYYFASPWIAEGGVRLNSSNPGAIKTQQQFLALTYGRVEQDLVTVRHAWGGERYQTIAANRYTNPFYNRTGLNVDIFHDF